MYNKVDTSLNFVAREKEILEFWDKNKVFEKTLKRSRDSKKAYSFYEGPPTANGVPHVGHILARSFKDVFPRLKSLQGFNVLRKAGWDTHGLPVELEVEKQLGLDGKKAIEQFGVAEFIAKCKESVFKYQTLWEEKTKRMGFFVDMQNPYITYSDEYIESVWWALKTIFDKGLLYKGHRVSPYCSRCGTALSSHEVAQGYKEVKDKSAYVKFKILRNSELGIQNSELFKAISALEAGVTGGDNTDVYFLAWTTTPWTLPSNVALCVNPEKDYALVELVKETGQDKEVGQAKKTGQAKEAGQAEINESIKSEKEYIILARDLIEKVIGEDTVYKVLKTFKGKELEHTKYEPLFAFASDTDKEKGFYVTADNYVSMDSGTGIVHIAPAFGEDDNRIGKKYNLPHIQFVDEAGKFVEAAHLFKGQFVKDADKHILKYLKDNGLLFKEFDYVHSYPFCWRCDTHLIYYARESWFIQTTKVKNNLIKNNKKINWLPASIGDGRMGNFLENVVDWGISRERYWGTPLPIWVCDICGALEAVGSKKELEKKSGTKVAELHKPYVDNVAYKCGARVVDKGSDKGDSAKGGKDSGKAKGLKDVCKGTMRRTPEVIDCWFDSGSMPFAQFGYPHKKGSKELFKQFFPAQFIAEGVDQTRGWFYTMLAISTLLFDKPSYLNCLVVGHVTDKHGKKMSKSKGNVVYAADVLEKHGADSVRWHFYSGSNAHLPTAYSDEGIIEVQRKVLGTLWNTYAFFVLYANIDKFNPKDFCLDKMLKGGKSDKGGKGGTMPPMPQAMPLIDRWVLSELNSLTDKVTSALEKYNVFEASRSIANFVDLLSNWYVRRNRERYWTDKLPTECADKASAYITLYTVLETLIRLMSPLAPFITESIYQNLVKSVDKSAPLSVHLTDYPKANKKLVDTKLESDMRLVLDVVLPARQARANASIKNRQPLQTLLVNTPIKLSAELLGIIKGEINVKDIKEVKDITQYVSYQVKPNLKTLGPKYSKLLPAIRDYLQAFSDATELVLQVNSASASAGDSGAGAVTINLQGQEIALTKEDLIIVPINKEGFSTESNGSITVVLDTNLTEELILEGVAREFVSKVQALRKEAGFEVTDFVNIYYFASDTKIQSAIATHQKQIASDTLAKQIISLQGGEQVKGYSKDTDIAGSKLILAVEKTFCKT